MTTSLLDYYQRHPNSSRWGEYEKFSRRRVLRVLGWYLRRKYKCENCSQRHETEEAAKECCVSSPPTSAWIHRHEPLNKQRIWKYSLLFGLPFIGFYLGCIYILVTSFSSWLPSAPIVYGVFVCLLYWRFSRGIHKINKLCEDCGVLADYNLDQGKPRCSRCQAKRNLAELDEDLADLEENTQPE